MNPDTAAAMATVSGVRSTRQPKLSTTPVITSTAKSCSKTSFGTVLSAYAAGIARDAKDQLLGYTWPGNVRELRNAIERAVILADGGYIRSEHLPVTGARQPSPASGETTGAPAAFPPGGVNLEAIG